MYKYYQIYTSNQWSSTITEYEFDAIKEICPGIKSRRVSYIIGVEYPIPTKLVYGAIIVFCIFFVAGKLIFK